MVQDDDSLCIADTYCHELPIEAEIFACVAVMAKSASGQVLI